MRKEKTDFFIFLFFYNDHLSYIQFKSQYLMLQLKGARQCTETSAYSK